MIDHCSSRWMSNYCYRGRRANTQILVHLHHISLQLRLSRLVKRQALYLCIPLHVHVHRHQQNIRKGHARLLLFGANLGELRHHRKHLCSELTNRSLLVLTKVPKRAAKWHEAGGVNTLPSSVINALASHRFLSALVTHGRQDP